MEESGLLKETSEIANTDVHEISKMESEKALSDSQLPEHSAAVKVEDYKEVLEIPGSSSAIMEGEKKNENVASGNVQSEIKDGSDTSGPPPHSLLKMAMDTKEAGSNACKAAASCHEVIAKAKDSMKFAQKRARLARREALRKCNLPNALNFTRISGILTEAANSVSSGIGWFERQANLADTAVKPAEDLAREMFAALEQNPSATTEDYLSSSSKVMKCAVDTTIAARKCECLLLKTMKKCWKKYPDLPGDSDDSDDEHEPDDCCLKYECVPLFMTIFFTVLGFVMLILFPALKPEGGSSITILAVGVMSEVWVLSYLVYKIVTYFMKKRSLAEIKKRDEMLRFIDERLEDLRQYFASRNISEPLDEDEIPDNEIPNDSEINEEGNLLQETGKTPNTER